MLGRDFCVNDFVVLRLDSQNRNKMESFGKLVKIISANNDLDLWFEIEEWNTEIESDDLNSFVISRPENVVHLLDPVDLPLHPPLAIWHDYSTLNNYICLRHVVL